MNLNPGAFSTGVILNKLLAHAAPSGSLVVTGGRFWAITLLSGRARPRRPWKLRERGSLSMVVPAAGEKKRTRGGVRLVSQSATDLGRAKGREWMGRHDVERRGFGRPTRWRVSTA